MTAVELDREDLLPFAPNITEAQADALIAGTIARTKLFLPDITADDFAYPEAAKALLTVAVLRQHKAAGGTVTTETIGPYTIRVDNSSLAQGGLYTEAEMAEWARMMGADTGGALTAGPVFSFPTPAPSWPDPAERYFRAW